MPVRTPPAAPPRRDPPVAASASTDASAAAKSSEPAASSGPSKAPGMRFKEPPKKKPVAEDSGTTASPATAAPGGQAAAVTKEPPKSNVKAPPVRVPKSIPEPSAPVSPPVQAAAAAPAEPEREEEDAGWLAEVEGPPSKAPPPQSPYYRVMPAPPDSSGVHGEQTPDLPPSYTASGDDAAPFKAKPSIKSGGGASQYPWPAATSVRSAAPEETGERPEPEEARGNKAPEGPLVNDQPSESQAKAMAEAPPRSRYKAPPAELSTPSRQAQTPNTTERRESPGDDAWNGWSGAPAKKEADKSSTPAGRVKAPPCYGGAASNAAPSPAPSAASTPSRVKAPPSSAKKSPPVGH